MTLTDVRCPMCDRLISGTEEIIYGKPAKILTTCRHCQGEVLLKYNSEFPPVYYYVPTGKTNA